MSAYDFSPLFRTAIGFDRLARLADSAQAVEANSFPPYNIERTGDDAYRLTLAIAGFGQDDVELTVKENTLIVSGKIANQPAKTDLLHRGIATRAFERRFVLADHIVVDGADLQNGLLHVSLKRVVPEALKPRRITIGSAAPRTISQTPGANDQQGEAQAA